jgi:triacylglycerol lipase
LFEITESAWKRLTGLVPFPQPKLIRTRYPVVLMHGFGLFASLRRGGHLHQEAMSLRTNGVLAYAPNVAAYNTVAARSEMWRRRLEHVLAETGADRLNLVAQSMGGLDARYLISQLGMHEVVAALVTVSTPHRGSAVAEIVLEQPEWARRWTADVLNRIGASSLEDASADFLRSIVELTPSAVEESFNPAVPDHPAVRYYSYAGRAGKGTDVSINPFLRVPCSMLYAREGVNDGFVSVESARWGTFLGAVDADHAQQVGLSMGRASFDAHAFYCDVVGRLAADGF